MANMQDLMTGKTCKNFCISLQFCIYGLCVRVWFVQKNCKTWLTCASYWHMFCRSIFVQHAQKKASALADAYNKSYDKAKSSFSVSFAFCKMYETLGSHPFFWRRFKILLLYFTSTSFRKSIKSSSFINAIILSAVNR